MVNKNDLADIEKVLENRTIRKVVMVAPSFLTDFKYPSIVNQLKKLGFDEVVEVTFGAKIVNREYHRLLKKSNELVISSTCPGVVEAIKNNPELKFFEKNLANIDSPMVAMGKVCKKIYPNYKIFFISPCHMKKVEANKSPFIDYVIDYMQLKVFFSDKGIEEDNTPTNFDKLYNDYTKIYPLSGGLSNTAKIHKILCKTEYEILDGWKEIYKLLIDIRDNPKKYKKLKFLDITFCEGSCIGGPSTNKHISIKKKRAIITKYMKDSLYEKIPEGKRGVFSKVSKLKFSS